MRHRHDRILVPLDMGERAEAAIELALESRDDERARIHLLHVVPENEIHLLRTVYQPETSGGANPESAREIAADWIRAVGDRHLAARASFETIIRTGYPPTEILRFAREAEVGLIVLAKHHPTSRFREWLLGSTAYDIVRRAPCDVFLVRDLDVLEKPVGLGEERDGMPDRQVVAEESQRRADL